MLQMLSSCPGLKTLGHRGPVAKVKIQDLVPILPKRKLRPEGGGMMSLTLR